MTQYIVPMGSSIVANVEERIQPFVGHLAGWLGWSSSSSNGTPTTGGSSSGPPTPAGTRMVPGTGHVPLGTNGRPTSSTSGKPFATPQRSLQHQRSQPVGTGAPNGAKRTLSGNW